jgi:hypothetical protein
MSIVLVGSTSGSVTLQEPAIAGSTVLTLPATSGTVLTSASTQVTGPAFSAYLNADVTITNNSFLKITCDVENFDTASVYSTSTGRFTPNVAGYYSIGGRSQILMSATNGEFFLAVYKNGSQFQRLTGVPAVANCYSSPASDTIVYLNGSTDYVELYGYQSSGVSRTLQGNTDQLTYFYGYLVRAA